jgi:putative membrane protein
MHSIQKYSPVFIALLFHVTGLLGILFTPYSEWFINNTPVVLLTMFLLLTNSQIKSFKAYILFSFIAFMTGMVTEIIGVNTGLLFGNYQYGQVLGPKIYGVPFLIGLNWFVIVYCSGAILTQGVELLQQKINIKISGFASSIFVIIGGATIATCFDFIIEPVAVKLHFWSWENGQIPLLNYACWFSISAILLGVKMYFKTIRINAFAINLLIIQTLFFLMLNLFL